MAEKADPLSDFLVKELTSRVDLETVDGRSRFQAIAKPLLKRLPEGTYRAAVMDALGESMHLVPDAAERNDVGRGTGRGGAAARAQRGQAQDAGAARDHLALHYPAAARDIAHPEQLEALNQPGAPLLRRILTLAASLPAPTTAQLLENLRDDPDLKHLERLVADEPLDGPEAAQGVLNDALERMVQDAAKTRASEALERIGPRPAPINVKSRIGTTG